MKYLNYLLKFLILSVAVLSFVWLLPIIFVLLSLIIPSDPEPLNKVFTDACSSELPKHYTIKSRDHSHSLAPQGVWYTERTYITTTQPEALKILKKLKE